MVWKKWLKTLMVALASTGIAVGQQPASKPAGVVTIQEANRPALKCRLLKTWTTQTGERAHQLQALDSGELVTVVEERAVATASGQPRTMSTRIYHWGHSNTPPAGCPMTEFAVETASLPSPAKEVVVGEMPAPAKAKTWESKQTERIIDRGTPVVVNEKPAVAATMAKTDVMPAPTMSAKVEPAKPTNWRESWGKPKATETKVAQAQPLKIDLPALPEAAPAKKEVAQVAASGSEKKGVPDTYKADFPVPATAAKADTAAPATTAKAELPATPMPLKADMPSTPMPVKTETPKAAPKVVAKTELPRFPKRVYNDAESKRPESTPTATADERVTVTQPVMETRESGSVVPAQPDPRGLNRPPVVAKTESPRFPKRVFNDGESKRPEFTPTATADERVTATQPVMEARESGFVVPPQPDPRGLIRPPQAPQPNQNLPRVVTGATPPPNAFATPTEASTYQEPANANMVVNAFSGAVPEGALGGPGVLATGSGRPGMMPAAPYNGAATPGGQAMASNVPAYRMPVPTQAPVQQTTFSATLRPDLATMHGDTNQLLATLKDSLYPSQREWAAEQLCSHDWKTTPQIVHALLAAAKDDPAASVRAGCVRCLVKMKANNIEVVQSVQSMKADSDPRVQREVEQALMILVPSQK